MKFKYNYFFVKNITNTRHQFWYLEELEPIFKHFNLTSVFKDKILGDKYKRYRWVPKEIFKALES